MNPEDVVMSFGCHKGKKLSQIPHDYLRWMEKNIADKPELIDNVKKVLAANKPLDAFDPKELQKNLGEIERQKKAVLQRAKFTLSKQNVDHVLSLGEALPREVHIRASTQKEMEEILQKCEEYTGCMVKTRWAAQGRVLLPDAQYAHVFKWQKSWKPIDIFTYNMDQTEFDPDEEERLACLEALNALAREQNPAEECS